MQADHPCISLHIFNRNPTSTTCVKYHVNMIPEFEMKEINVIVNILESFVKLSPGCCHGSANDLQQAGW